MQNKFDINKVIPLVLLAFSGVVILCACLVFLFLLGQASNKDRAIRSTATEEVSAAQLDVSAIQTEAVQTAMAALPAPVEEKSKESGKPQNTDIPRPTSTDGPTNTPRPTQTPKPTAIPPTSTAGYVTHKVGDSVVMKEITITLNSTDVTGGLLRADFTLVNNGPEEESVSSIMEFTAKTSDGTKLEMEYIDCGPSTMNGSVLPGDKLRGEVCWKGVTTFPVKIYFTPEFFDRTTAVWEVNQ